MKSTSYDKNLQSFLELKLFIVVIFLIDNGTWLLKIRLHGFQIKLKVFQLQEIVGN
jgi:hypothetical protein